MPLRPFHPARLPLELEGLLGLRAGAGFLWTVPRLPPGPLGILPAGWTPGRLYRWTKVQPRHADRSHCQTSPSFGSAPKVWRHTSSAPPPPAHTRPPRRGRQTRPSASHSRIPYEVVLLKYRSCAERGQPRRQVTDGPGGGTLPRTAPGLPTGPCFSFRPLIITPVPPLVNPAPHLSFTISYKEFSLFYTTLIAHSPIYPLSWQRTERIKITLEESE